MLNDYKLHDSNSLNYFVFQASYIDTNLMNFEHNSKIIMETLMYTYLHKLGSSKEKNQTKALQCSYHYSIRYVFKAR